MSNEKKAPLAKRFIKPISITLKVTATQINENGNFSQYSIEEVKGSGKAKLKASAPTFAGGAIYIGVESAEGVEFITTTEAAKAEKKKLF